MSALKSLARVGLHSLGGLSAVRWWNRRGVGILGYHGFPPEHKPWLEWQCSWIRKHFAPVAMRDIADSLETGRPLPPNALAVTIDDGFADFFDTGFPVFQTHGIPTTVFLISDFLDHRIWLWWLRIVWAFRHSSRASFEWEGRKFLLDSSAHRHAAAEDILASAKLLPNAARLALCSELCEALAVTLPPDPPAEWLPMTWDQVRQLHRQGVEFGAHTVTHPILSTLETQEAMKQEILGSKKRVEQELGCTAEHFAYPNGRWQDIGEQADRIVREAGFRTAVSFEAGLNYRPDRFLLHRLGADLTPNRRQFAETVSGLHHLSHR